jgi:hypothetical protein
MRIVMKRFLPLALLLFISCDGVEDLLDPYEAPLILNIVKSDDQVTPGDTVTITVEAENPEEGVLYYDWSAPDGGRFVLPADQPVVQWVAPFQGGIKKIYCTVSNEEKSTETHVQIEVLNTQKPIVVIDAPQNGSRYVQYSEIEVDAQAYHENGIYRVWFLINGSVVDSTGYAGSDQYTFSFVADSARWGELELTVRAEAAAVSVKGETSVVIFVDGILPGKKGM